MERKWVAVGTCIETGNTGVKIDKDGLSCYGRALRKRREHKKIHKSNDRTLLVFLLEKIDQYMDGQMQFMIFGSNQFAATKLKELSNAPSN